MVVLSSRFAFLILLLASELWRTRTECLVQLSVLSKTSKPRVRRKAPLFVQTPDKPLINNSPSKRRKKKNKYEKFSKVEKEKDPFESLVAESKQKAQELRDELEMTKKASGKPRPKIAPLGKLEFPDSKEIDPYDPTTFGYIEIGTIVGAHGVYGELKVSSVTDFPKDRLCTPGIRHLKPAKKRAPRQLVLLEGRHRYKDEYLVRLEDVNDRDAAQRLRGSILYVREEDKVIPQQEEYLVSDLVGLDVFLLQEGNERNDAVFVGTVGGIVFADELCSIPGLGNDQLEVKLQKERGKDVDHSFQEDLVLIPFVPEIVPHIEIEEGYLYIDPPEGLLDLTFTREEKVSIKGFLPHAPDSDHT